MPYETKPMKKQWLDVEGRMTPIILPQIWNHELQDWVVTSEQNPLPTQLYGSIVELYLSDQTNTLTPGSSLSILTRERVLVKEIRVIGRGGGELRLRYQPESSGSYSARIDKTVDFSGNGKPSTIETLSDTHTLTLTNQTERDISLVRLSVLGVY